MAWHGRTARATGSLDSRYACCMTARRSSGFAVTLGSALMLLGVPTRCEASVSSRFLGPSKVQEERSDGVRETRFESGALETRYSVDDEECRDGDFVEYFEDGTVRIEAKYAKGELHGAFTEFDTDGNPILEVRYRKGKRHGYYRTIEDGTTTLEATYKKGVLHGRHEVAEPDGSLLRVAYYKAGVLEGRLREKRPNESWEHAATYEKGVLHGPAKITVGRKTVSRRTWDEGRLVELDGRVPFPRMLEEVRADIAAASRPLSAEVNDLDAADPTAEDRLYALQRLRTYRALCGLHWDHIVLKGEWNELCDAASEVSEANGELTHWPEKPEGFDDERFRQGYLGAGKCNLAGDGLRRSVEEYMDDSDPTNIDRVGHRRWCLNPTMGKTGFGVSGVWSAMWATDNSGPSNNPESVMYPPAGHVPVDLFGPRYAWSIQVYRGKIPSRDEDLKVEIVRLDEWFQARGEPLELDYVHVDDCLFGYAQCLIFRPVGLRVEPGAVYRARVSVDAGKSFAYDYIVAFVEETPSDLPDANVAAGSTEKGEFRYGRER